MSNTFYNDLDNCSTDTNCCAPAPATTTPSQRPEFNVTQKSEGVSISIDLPGVTADKLSVTTEKQQLKVKASRCSETPSEWALLNQVERPAAYSLRLNVHRDLDLSQIKAKFRNGVLLLDVAKRAESLPKKIDIDSAS